jgi:membrane protease YdiL (CAAX protease family)
MASNNWLSQLSKISLGVVIVLFWVWMYLRADILFSANGEAMRKILQTYIFMAMIVFGVNSLKSEESEKALFKVSFLKAIPKFLIGAFITLVVLVAFQYTFTNNVSINIFEAVTGLGVGVILLHALFVATIEEKIFRNWLPNQLASGNTKMFAWLLSAIIFAFFHYVMNGQWLTIIIYIPLGLTFQFVREKWSPKTDMANSGVHFAWNIWILGFLNAI